MEMIRAILPQLSLLVLIMVIAVGFVKKINIGFGDLLPEEMATCDLFTDMKAEQRERSLQHAIIDVKGRYGKNALVMGRNLRPEATGRERNNQVGGHHA